MNINGPLVFTVAGYVLGEPRLGSPDGRCRGPIDPRDRRADARAPAVRRRVEGERLQAQARRFCCPGACSGSGSRSRCCSAPSLAAWLFDDLSWALAGFVGATLAPTDAALSAQVINDERDTHAHPPVLNVESGLNDGIVTPVVAFTLAVAASRARHRRARRLRRRSARCSSSRSASGRPRARARERLPAHVRFASALDRRRRSAAGRAGCRAQQLRAGGRSRRQRFHRGLRGRHRLRRRLDDESSTWMRPASCRSSWARSWRLSCGSSSAPCSSRSRSTLRPVDAGLRAAEPDPCPLSRSRSPCVGPGLDGRPSCSWGGSDPGVLPRSCSPCWQSRSSARRCWRAAVAAVALTVLLSVVLHGVSAGPLAAAYARSRQHA